MRVISRRPDGEGRIRIPKVMLGFFSDGTRILWFNPIAVMCPRSVSLGDVERSLQRSLNELRRRIHEDSLGSYVTH